MQAKLCEREAIKLVPRACKICLSSRLPLVIISATTIIIMIIIIIITVPSSRPGVPPARPGVPPARPGPVRPDQPRLVFFFVVFLLILYCFSAAVLLRLSLFTLLFRIF